MVRFDAVSECEPEMVRQPHAITRFTNLHQQAEPVVQEMEKRKDMAVKVGVFQFRFLKSSTPFS